MGTGVTYIHDSLVPKTTVRVARDLLDRFFRDAEGKTNRRLDVYYTLEHLDVSRERAGPAVDFLVSRGLINVFGPDIAYLTDKGIQAVLDEMDLGDLPQEIRDFAAPHPTPPSPSGPVQPVPSPSDPPAMAVGRPDRATLTHIALDGQEFAVELGVQNSIGRSDGNTIQIGDKRASKSHAEIRYESGQFILRDLESANGTLINGDYVIQPVVLKHDDEIVIGRTMLLFTAPDNVPPPFDYEPISVGPSTFEPPASPPEQQAGYRVIQGTPADRGPFAGNLFAEPPSEPSADGPGLFDGATSDTSDLFEPPMPAESADDMLFADPRSEPDLFDDAPGSVPADRDLFADDADPPPLHEAHLFGEPEPGGAEAQVVQSLPPGLEVTPLAEGLQADLQQPSLEEIEHFEPLDDEPDRKWASEMSGSSAPRLETPSVSTPSGDLPPLADAPAEPQTDDLATLMVARTDMFGRESGPEAAPPPPPWGGDDRRAYRDPSGAGAAQPASDTMVRLVEIAERLPVATEDLPDGDSRSLAPNDSATGSRRADVFAKSLERIEARLNEVDVPEKRTLLKALEVLSQHPFVREALDGVDDA